MIITKVLMLWSNNLRIVWLNEYKLLYATSKAVEVLVGVSMKN